MKEATLKNIQKELRALGDKKIAEHSQGFFKTGKGEYGEGDVFLGIRVPVVRKVAKAFKALPIEECIELLHSRYHEERQCALVLLVQRYNSSDDATQAALYKTYLNNVRYINNWDLVDLSAHPIVGHYLFDKSRAPLHKLSKSPDLWERRIAIIATLYFIRKEDYTDTLKISKTLLNHPEDLIHKAVGWMLREVGKRDFDVEVQFLDQHYKKMPRTMLRYAIEKLDTPLRKSYLEGTR